MEDFNLLILAKKECQLEDCIIEDMESLISLIPALIKKTVFKELNKRQRTYKENLDIK